MPRKCSRRSEKRLRKSWKAAGTKQVVAISCTGGVTSIAITKNRARDKNWWQKENSVEIFALIDLHKLNQSLTKVPICRVRPPFSCSQNLYDAIPFCGTPVINFGKSCANSSSTIA